MLGHGCLVKQDRLVENMREKGSYMDRGKGDNETQVQHMRVGTGREAETGPGQKREGINKITPDKT